MAQPNRNNVTSINATQAALEAELAKLREQNAALQAKMTAKNKVSMKVGAKGGLSVYGLGRFPVTLYREQWERLLSEGENIKAFIAAHASELSVKE